jgi:Nucleotidyl transferase AbiEii toxin, Type IV TA system
VSAGDFDLIFDALQLGRVRYLVVGGVAVVLHGHPRFTADLDLVVALDPENARAAIAALARLGYRPRAPVDGALFADPEARQGWIDEKGLTVFTLWSPEHPATEIDLFVREPFPFGAAWARATMADLGGVKVPVASIEDLVALKRVAGRPKDLEDIRVLEAIARERNDG